MKPPWVSSFARMFWASSSFTAETVISSILSFAIYKFDFLQILQVQFFDSLAKNSRSDLDALKAPIAS